MIAAVCGEIEKTQWGEAQGAEYRGYAAGSRHLVGHGGIADMCILGEPTEGKLVVGHFGSLWVRISTQGNFIHTAFSENKKELNSILRMQDVLAAVREWIPSWEHDPDNSYQGSQAIVNVGAINGGFGWRVSRTPHRTDLFLDVRVPPTKPMATARRQVLEMTRGLANVFLTMAWRPRSTSPRLAPRSIQIIHSSAPSRRRTRLSLAPLQSVT